MTPYGSEWAWVIDAAPAADLDGKSVARCLKWLSRETGLEVRFTDEGTRRIATVTSVRGAPVRAGPEALLRVVLEASELAYRIDDGILWVGPGSDGGGR